MVYHRLYILLHTVFSFTVTCTVTVSAVLSFTANVSLLFQLNGEFDGIWTSCGLPRRFGHGDGDFGFYDHSGIMTKMVWSELGTRYLKSSGAEAAAIWQKKRRCRLSLLK